MARQDWQMLQEAPNGMRRDMSQLLMVPTVEVTRLEMVVVDAIPMLESEREIWGGLGETVVVRGRGL